jgi:hypothetical protein
MLENDNESERKNWLDQYMYLLREAETPRRFLYWSGLAAISGVVRDQVWLNKRGLYQLYPNIFVMMVGKSGLKKSFAVSKAKELVTLVNGTRIISGQNSIQGIISELGTAKTDDKGNVLKESHAFIAAEEFGDLIIEDPSAFTTLTNLYDRHYHKEYTRTLKNSPKQKLTNVNITLLGASSPSYFKRAVPNIHITGGFLARFLVLYEDKKARLNPLVRPLTEQEKETVYTPERLLPHLRSLQKVKGEFKFEDNEALSYFENWYYNFYEAERSDDTGYEDRINDHILKVAMLLALCEPEPELILKVQHIEKAIELTQSLIVNIHRATMGVGGSPLAQAMQVVLKDIIELGKIRRDELLMRHYGEFTADELDRVEMTLEQAGLIDVEHYHGKATYQLTKKGENYYQKAKEKKKEKK